MSDGIEVLPDGSVRRGQYEWSAQFLDAVRALPPTIRMVKVPDRRPVTEYACRELSGIARKSDDFQQAMVNARYRLEVARQNIEAFERLLNEKTQQGDAA